MDGGTESVHLQAGRNSGHAEAALDDARQCGAGYLKSPLSDQNPDGDTGNEDDCVSPRAGMTERGKGRMMAEKTPESPGERPRTGAAR
jgi:hypothetical protein